MFRRITAVPPLPQAPPQADQQPPAPAPRGRFRKKLFIIPAAVLLIIIVVAAAFFIPQGAATIPLNADYVVGEKMVYDTTMSMSLDLGSSLGSIAPQSPTTTNIDAQQTIEVVGFDGENYLLNHTITMTLLNKPMSISMMEKMNKTGYSSYFLNIGDTQTEVPQSSLTGNSYLAQLLSQPEVKIGESINVPFPNNSPNIQTTGDLTIKFNDVQDLTVPAGTYRVFRIDIVSNNLKLTVNIPQSAASSLLQGGLIMNLNLSCQIYMEYGTMRQIKSSLQENASYESSFANMTMQMGMDMTLKEHIKP